VTAASGIVIRTTEPRDDAGIEALTRAVYPGAVPWTSAQLDSHRDIFPEGQFVALEGPAGRVVGMAASLIIWWDDYAFDLDWQHFTDKGMFTNHDPARGRTLYGAEVMVHPRMQGRGIGKQLYAARRDLVERLGLVRIRAGARLRGYHKYADTLTAEQYAMAVVRGSASDPTLTFQLKQGFDVLAVVSGYLRHDPESLGYAAVIEWINANVARPEDYAGRDRRFARATSRESQAAP
jgi:GNAT superfamily N-acetyltransferase